jgi:hypothetical protein
MKIMIKFNGNTIEATRTERVVNRNDPTSSVTWDAGNAFKLNEVWSYVTGHIGNETVMTSCDEENLEIDDVADNLFNALESIYSARFYIDFPSVQISRD